MVLFLSFFFGHNAWPEKKEELNQNAGDENNFIINKRHWKGADKEQWKIKEYIYWEG